MKYTTEFVVSEAIFETDLSHDAIMSPFSSFAHDNTCIYETAYGGGYKYQQPL